MYMYYLFLRFFTFSLFSYLFPSFLFFSNNYCSITRALYLNCITVSLGLLPSSMNITVKLTIAMTLRELVIECQHDLLNQTETNSINSELPSQQFCFLTTFHETFKPQGGDFISIVEVALSSWKGYYFVQPIYQYLYGTINERTLTSQQIQTLTVQAITTTTVNNSSYVSRKQ